MIEEMGRRRVVPYWVFVVYGLLPIKVQMRLFWWAMRAGRYELAYNLADHMMGVPGEDEMIAFAARCWMTGRIR